MTEKTSTNNCHEFANEMLQIRAFVIHSWTAFDREDLTGAALRLSKRFRDTLLDLRLCPQTGYDGFVSRQNPSGL